MKRSKWRLPWPNAADFRFNVHTLLADAEKRGCIARFPKKRRPRVAIVGAGAAGLTAARELVRCGARAVHVYEASSRIGGRLWSERILGQRRTTYELGAMRIPRFRERARGKPSSAFEYYQRLFDIDSVDFPNPGSEAAGMTGIYVNGGRGPGNESAPGLLAWDTREGACRPPSPELVAVYKKWKRFADRVKKACAAAYETDRWDALWKGIVATYWDKDFADLVFMDAGKSKKQRRGDFGGLGMSEDEARLFYVIGAGDGGWGAFFNVGALYVIRTLLFGFGDGHQLIVGCNTPPQVSKRQTTNLRTLPAPAFLGIQSLAECLLYAEIDGEPSVFDRLGRPKSGVELFVDAPVERICKVDGGVEIHAADLGVREPYDAVILTAPTWALQLGIQLEGFDAEDLPPLVVHSLTTSHWITSCKVFWPLRKRIDPAALEVVDGNLRSMPPLIMTDTFLQGVYAYATDESDAGALLISYTWEDDATKLVALDPKDLAIRCLDQLAAVLETCGIGDLDEYVDRADLDRTRVIHWAEEKHYAGCAKLYRERMWNENYALLRYNQKLAGRSKLYFAGDAYSLESGWVEAALRSALDAVVWICQRHGARGFDYERYPKRPNWTEEQLKALAE